MEIDFTLTPGCYIDCGHMSWVDLNYRIIKFAADYGWNGGSYDLNLIDSDWLTYLNGDIPPEFIHEGDFEEALNFAADDAVQFLNSEIVSGGCYWTIEDNSLYLMEDQDD